MGKKRMVLEVAIECLIICICWSCYDLWWSFHREADTQLRLLHLYGIHMGYVYLVVPVVGTCMVIYSIINIARALKQGENVGKRGGRMSIAWVSGLIILVLLVILLLAGVPIAIALAVSSIAAILPVLDFQPAVLTGAQRIFSGISVFSLLAIPFFILAGNIMNKGGIAVRLINFAKLFTGRIPGALAHTNAVANMLFGAISGSGTAAASAMGSIIGPIEEERGL